MFNGITDEYQANKYLGDNRQNNLTTQQHDLRKPGRVSRSAAFKLKLLRLQSDHVSGVADNVVDYLVRHLCNLPDHTKRNPDFIKQFRTTIEFLNDYRYKLQKENKKFAYSRALVVLLTKYVLLERDGLYSMRIYSTKDERNVERNVLRLLQNVCMDPSKDNTHPYLSTIRALHVLQEVVNSYKENGKLVDNMIRRLLGKLGLLEKFDNYHNNRDGLTNKELDLLSSGSCYDDNQSVKDKIELANLSTTAFNNNNKFYDEKLLMPKPLKQEESDTTTHVVTVDTMTFNESELGQNFDKLSSSRQGQIKDNQYESDGVLDRKDFVNIYRHQSSNLRVVDNNMCDNTSTNVKHYYKNYFSQILNNYKFNDGNIKEYGNNGSNNKRQLPRNAVIIREEIILDDSDDEDVVTVDVKKENRRPKNNNNNALVILNPESILLSSDEDDDCYNVNVANLQTVNINQVQRIAQLNLHSNTNLTSSVHLDRISTCTGKIFNDSVLEDNTKRTNSFNEVFNIDTHPTETDKRSYNINDKTLSSNKEIEESSEMLATNNVELTKEVSNRYCRITLKSMKDLFDPLPETTSKDKKIVSENDRINEETLLKEDDDFVCTNELRDEDEEKLLSDNVLMQINIERNEECVIDDSEKSNNKEAVDNFNDTICGEGKSFDDSSIKISQVSYLEEVDLDHSENAVPSVLRTTEFNIEKSQSIINTTNVSMTESDCCNFVDTEDLSMQDEVTKENEAIKTNEAAEEVVTVDTPVDYTKNVSNEEENEQPQQEQQHDLDAESFRQNDNVGHEFVAVAEVQSFEKLNIVEATERLVDDNYEDVQFLSNVDGTETCEAVLIEQDDSPCIMEFTPEPQTCEIIKLNPEHSKIDRIESSESCTNDEDSEKTNGDTEGALMDFMLLVDTASSCEKVAVTPKETSKQNKLKVSRKKKKVESESLNSQMNKTRFLRQISLKRKGKTKEDTRRKPLRKPNKESSQNTNKQTERNRFKNKGKTNNSKGRNTRNKNELIRLEDEQQPNTFTNDKYLHEEPKKKIYTPPLAATEEIVSVFTSDDSSDDKLVIAFSGSETELDKEENLNKVVVDDEEETVAVTISIPEHADILIEEDTQDDIPLLLRLNQNKNKMNKKDIPMKQNKKKKFSDSPKTIDKQTTGKRIGNCKRKSDGFDSLTLYENAVKYFNIQDKEVVPDGSKTIIKKPEKCIKTKAAMKEYKELGIGDEAVNLANFNSAIDNKLAGAKHHFDATNSSNIKSEESTVKRKASFDDGKRGRKKQRKSPAKKKGDDSRIKIDMAEHLTSAIMQEEEEDVPLNLSKKSRMDKRNKSEERIEVITEETFEVSSTKKTVEVIGTEENDKLSHAEESVKVKNAEESIKVRNAEENVEVTAEKCVNVNNVEESVKLSVIEENFEVNHAEECVEVSSLEEIVEVNITEERVEVSSAIESFEVSHTEEKVKVTDAEDILEMSNTKDNVEINNAEKCFERSNEEESIEERNVEEVIEVSNEEKRFEISNTKESFEVNQVEESIQVSNAEESIEVTNVEESVEVSNTIESFEVSIAEESIEVSNAKESFEVSIAEECIEVSNVEECFEVSNTKESFEVSIAEESIEVSNIEECFGVSNAEENFEISHAKEIVEVSNTKESFEVSIAEESIEIRNVEECFDVSNVEERFEISHAEEIVEVSNAKDSFEINNVEVGFEIIGNDGDKLEDIDSVNEISVLDGTEEETSTVAYTDVNDSKCSTSTDVQPTLGQEIDETSTNCVKINVADERMDSSTLNDITVENIIKTNEEETFDVNKMNESNLAKEVEEKELVERTEDIKNIDEEQVIVEIKESNVEIQDTADTNKTLEFNHKNVENVEINSVNSFRKEKIVEVEVEPTDNCEKAIDSPEISNDELSLEVVELRSSRTYEINDDPYKDNKLIRNKVQNIEEIYLDTNVNDEESHETIEILLENEQEVTIEPVEDKEDGEIYTGEDLSQHQQSIYDQRVHKETAEETANDDKSPKPIERVEDDENVKDCTKVVDKSKNRENVTFEEEPKCDETSEECDSTIVDEEPLRMNVSHCDNMELAAKLDENTSNAIESYQETLSDNETRMVFVNDDASVQNETVYFDCKKFDEDHTLTNEEQDAKKIVEERTLVVDEHLVMEIDQQESLEIDQQCEMSVDTNQEIVSEAMDVVESHTVETDAVNDLQKLDLTNEIRREPNEIFIAKEIDFNNEIIVNMPGSKAKEAELIENETVTLHETPNFDNTLKDAAESICSATTSYITSDSHYMDEMKNTEELPNSTIHEQTMLDEEHLPNKTTIDEHCTIQESCNSIQETCEAIQEPCTIIEVSCNNNEEHCSVIEDHCESTVVVNNCDPSEEEITNFIHTYVGDSSTSAIQKENVNVVSDQCEKSKSYYGGQEINDHEYYGPADLLVSGKCDKDLKRTSAKDNKGCKNMDNSLEDNDTLYPLSEEVYIGTLMVANVPVSDVIQVDTPSDYVLNESDNQLTFNFINDELNQSDTITIDDSPDDTPSSFTKLHLKDEREDYHDDDWTTQTMTNNVNFINENLPPDAIEQYEQYEPETSSYHPENWNNNYDSEKSVSGNSFQQQQQEFSKSMVENCNSETHEEVDPDVGEVQTRDANSMQDTLPEPNPSASSIVTTSASLPISFQDTLTVSIADTLPVSLSDPLPVSLPDALSHSLPVSLPDSLSVSHPDPLPVSTSNQIAASSSSNPLPVATTDTLTSQRGDIRSDMTESIRSFPLTNYGFSDIDNINFLPSFAVLPNNQSCVVHTTVLDGPPEIVPTTSEPKRSTESLWPPTLNTHDLISRNSVTDKKDEGNGKDDDEEDSNNRRRFGALINIYKSNRKSLNVNNIKHKIAKKMETNFPIRVNSRTPVVSSNKKPSPPQSILSSPSQILPSTSQCVPSTSQSIPSTSQCVPSTSDSIRPVAQISSYLQNDLPLASSSTSHDLNTSFLTENISLTEETAPLTENTTSIAERQQNITLIVQNAASPSQNIKFITRNIKSPRLMTSSPTLSNRTQRYQATSFRNNSALSHIKSLNQSTSGNNKLSMESTRSLKDATSSRNTLPTIQSISNVESIRRNSLINIDSSPRLKNTHNDSSADVDVILPNIKEKFQQQQQRNINNKTKELTDDSMLTKNNNKPVREERKTEEIYENKYDIVKLRQRQTLDSKLASTKKLSETKVTNQRTSIGDKQKETNDDKKKKKKDVPPNKKTKLSTEEPSKPPATSPAPSRVTAEYLFDNLIKEERSKAAASQTTTNNVDEKDQWKSNDVNARKRKIWDNSLNDESEIKRQKESLKNNKLDDVKKHNRESTPSRRETYLKKEYEANRDNLFNPEGSFRKDYHSSKDKKVYPPHKEIHKEDICKEAGRREEARKEDVRKEEFRKEDTRREDVRRQDVRREDNYREENRYKDDKRRRDYTSFSGRSYYQQLRKDPIHQVDDKRRRFDTNNAGRDVQRPSTIKTNQRNDYTRHLIDGNPQKSSSSGTLRNESQQGLNALSNIRVVDPRRNPNNPKYYKSQQNWGHTHNNHKNNVSFSSSNPIHPKSHNTSSTKLKKSPLHQYGMQNSNISRTNSCGGCVNDDTNWLDMVSPYLDELATASDALIPRARRKLDRSTSGNDSTNNKMNSCT